MKNTLIYVVEDNVMYANLVRNTLESKGYRNIQMFETKEELLDTLYKNPSIVILDYHLNKENGIDILKEIKSVNPNIEVIFLSGQQDMTVAINALKYGAFEYIEKNDDAFLKLETVLVKLERFRSAIEEKEQNIKRKRILVFVLIILVSILTVINLIY